MKNFIKKFQKTADKIPSAKPPENPEDKFGFFQTLAAAMLCAVIVRSFFFEPFHIPSGSMKPNLLIGDYIFVSKFSYGYSRYSFPLGYKFFEGRIFSSTPKRGDVVVFRLPSDPKVNYVKRLIGFPGDKIQVRDGVVYLNNRKIEKVSDGFFDDKDLDIGKSKIPQFSETLPEGKVVTTLDQAISPQDNTGIYEVPQGHYFMMGDNRDNSQDSRFLNEVGYVPEENLIGRASFIFFSSRYALWQLWEIHHSIRFDRIFKKLN